jgi:glutamate carboxypeptidase
MTPRFAAQIRRYVEEHSEALFQYLRSLVLAESPSTEPETQRQMFELLAEPLRELGFQTRFLRGRQSGGQLYARPSRRPGGAPVQLLLGHCDTVWPVGTLARMPLVVENNVMRGPGVYDMKAGLAQIVFSLRALAALGFKPEATPVVYISTDEELGSEDSRYRIQLLARRVVRVLVPEPSTGTAGKLKTGRKGVGLFTVTVHGRGAHAGVEPEKGVSAVLEMSHIVQELHSMSDPGRGVTVTVGVVEGGTRSNIIPDRARALVDVRVRTLADGDAVASRIRGLKPTLAGTRVDVEGGLDRPPLERTPRNRALWERARKTGRLLGIELEESESGGGSDGNLTSPFAATLDGLGGVGGGAHAADEFIYLDKLLERTALLALLIAAPADARD